jgi:hypothetical protein
MDEILEVTKSPLVLNLVKLDQFNNANLSGADLQWKILGIMKRVRKFVSILKSFNYYNKIENLGIMNIDAIGDKCFYVLS